MVKITWPSVMLVLASMARAQEPAQSTPAVVPAPPPTGTVTGHVTASDTQRAARLVRVALLQKLPPANGDDESESSQRLPIVFGRSGLDGNFVITNVPEGDYYVFGEMPGYLQPYKRLEKDEGDDDVSLAKAMADVPVIHVTAGRTSTKEITIQHGAVISGRVVYDDGSPAANLRVNWEPMDGVDLDASDVPALLMASGITNFSITDDRGRFRAVGVAPGKYRLMTHVVAEDEFQWAPGGANVMETFSAQDMTVYAPGKFRKSEAQIVEVRGDEEVPDIEIKIALDSTHTVSGRALAKEDNHAPNRSLVMLVDPSGELPERTVRVNGQGVFHFSYVPPGSYELRIQGRDSVPAVDPRFNQQIWKTAKDYQPVKVNVLVDDQDVKVDDVLVERLKKKE